jgi:multiple antibiotic resistance protein
VLGFSLIALSAVFFVVDPFTAVPLFLQVTTGQSSTQRRRTALKAAVAAFVTLTSFAIAGRLIFLLFGFSLGAFKIAGGILLLLMAIDMMRAQPSRVRVTPEERDEGVEATDVAIIPLAIPMLSGPGAIATVMVLTSQAGSLPRQLAVEAAIFLTCVAAYIILRLAAGAERVLKQTGINILNRVMGLILTGVAVQFMVNGLHDVIPQIRGS